MINNLKDKIYAAFAISLVASYFGCFGYYLYFNVDISSYLSVEDLIMIFAKWIWITALFAFTVIHILISFFKKAPRGNSYWDTTIKGTRIKRRAFLILPILICIIILLIFYQKIRILSALLVVIAVALFFIILFFRDMSKGLLRIENLNLVWLQEKGFWIINFSFFLIIGLPTIGGILLANNVQRDNIVVRFDDNEILNSKDSANLLYIGKTHEVFFLYNSNSKTTTSYKMDRVKSIEVIETAIKFK